MVNLNSSRSEIKLFWKFTKKQPGYIQEQPIKKLLWNSFTINSSCTLDNLHALDNYNNKFWPLWRTWVLWTILILPTFSYCCFCKAVSNHYFQKKVLLINFICTYHSWLKNFRFTHFLLIKGYGKYSFRKESVIAPFADWFKTERVVLMNFISTYRNLLKTCSFLTFNERKPWAECSTKWSSHCSFPRAT